MIKESNREADEKRARMERGIARIQAQFRGRRARSGKKKKGKGSPKCVVCGKSVFAVEKLEAIGQVFHDTCFRCQKCGKHLTLSNSKEHEGHPYCAPCFGRTGGARNGFG